MLSYEQVGAAAILSRATAGIYQGKLIVSTPGSPAAVQLAWEKLILPELQHLAWENENGLLFSPVFVVEMNRRQDGGIGGLPQIVQKYP